LGEGISFKDPAQPSVSFKNKNTRIDHLGNIEVKRDGKWKAFFPLMIYQTHLRNQARNPANPYHGSLYLNDFNDETDNGDKLYGKMGFNASAWARTPEDIKSLVAGGLEYVNFDISGYCKEWDKKGSYPLDSLEKDWQNVLDEGLEDHVLFFYHDNELSLHQVEWYDLLKEVRRISDKPIYQLNGFPGNGANFHNSSDQLIDATGTYINKKQEGFTNRRWAILNNQQNMNVPALIAQHTELSPNPTSGGHDQHPRPVIYAAIANGARVYAYFQDIPLRNLVGDQKLEYDKY